MPTIRQEINLLNTTLNNASTFGQDIAQLDTSQYVNPTYYFEVVARNTHVSTAGTVQLFNKTNAGNVTNSSVSVPANTATFTRYRSSSMTIPAGAKEYYTASFSLSGLSVKAARIIVIDAPTTLTNTETQIEIGNWETGKTNTTDAALTNPKYWKYTAANWDGTKTFYAEVTYNRSSNMDTTTIKLQEDNGSFASWADKVTIVSAGTATAATRVRSSSFTPTDGRNYRIVSVSSSNMSSYSIFNTKVIVDQSPVKDSYLVDDTGVANMGIVASATGRGQSFLTTSAYDAKSVEFKLGKSGSPTDNIFVEVADALNGTVVGTSDNVAGSSLSSTRVYTSFNFSTPIALSNATTYFFRLKRSGAVDLSNYYQMAGDTGLGYAGGNSLSFNGTTWSNDASSPPQIDVDIKINGTVTPTKLEPQYLLLNTADDNTTNKQTYQTLWDSTEWDGVTNTYTHAIDSDNASNSADLVDINNSDAQVTNSSVTGANQQISSALTMPTSGNQIDTDIDNTTGVVAASRILVAVSVVAASLDTAIQALPAIIANRFVGPMALRMQFRQPYMFPPITSTATNYLQDLSGALSFTGADTVRANRPLTGSVSFTGGVVRAIAKVFTASASFVGALTKRTARSLAGTVSFVGTLANRSGRPLTASVSSSGTLTRRIGKTLTGVVSFSGSTSKAISRLLTGTVSFSAVLAKRTARTVTGAVSFTGVFTASRLSLVSLTGSVSFVGAVIRRTLKTLNGTVSSTGAISKRDSRSLTGTVTFSGALARSARRLLAGAVSFTGSLVTSSVRFVTLAAASVSMSGLLIKRTGKSVTGSLSFTGSLGRRASRSLTASLSFAGTLARRTVRSLSGALSFTGAVSRRAGRALSGVLSFIGATSKRTNRSLTGTVSETGSLGRQEARSVSGNVTFTPTLVRRLQRGLSAALSAVGSLTKRTGRSLSAAVSSAGVLATTLIHAGTGFTSNLTASLSFSGSLNRGIVKSVAGGLSWAGTLIRDTAERIYRLLNPQRFKLGPRISALSRYRRGPRPQRGPRRP